MGILLLLLSHFHPFPVWQLEQLGTRPTPTGKGLRMWPRVSCWLYLSPAPYPCENSLFLKFGKDPSFCGSVLQYFVVLLANSTNSADCIYLCFLQWGLSKVGPLADKRELDLRRRPRNRESSWYLSSLDLFGLYTFVFFSQIEKGQFMPILDTHSWPYCYLWRLCKCPACRWQPGCFHLKLLANNKPESSLCQPSDPFSTSSSPLCFSAGWRSVLSSLCPHSLISPCSPRQLKIPGTLGKETID